MKYFFIKKEIYLIVKNYLNSDLNVIKHLEKQLIKKTKYFFYIIKKDIKSTNKII